MRSLSLLAVLLLGLAGVVGRPALAQPVTGPEEALPTLGLTIGEGPIFVVPIEGMIDLVLSRYVDRALADAERAEAAAVVFHVDTFGGLVDAADRIRSALLHAQVPTVAFIDPNAASAGALISLAADRIVMAPGASIGAATAVDATGDYASEKVQSYMRGLMRATAEAKGRDPRLAEAMVDERLAVEGVVTEGQLLTLSAREAAELGLADAVLPTYTAVIAALGADDGREVVYHRAGGTERVLRFFGSPVVASLLMVMMLGGIYFEVRTPGLGVPGVMAAMAAALFFAPHYLLGLVHGWEVVLFFLGVLLILVELFVLPGFGVAGISGIGLVLFSLTASRIGNVGFSFPGGGEVSQAIVTLAASLVILVALMYSLGRYLPRLQSVNQLILAPELGSALGYTSAHENETLVGRRGLALTTLRPAGTAEIDGERVDVVSQGTFIAAGEPVEVVRVRGSRVEVRPARSAAEATPAPGVA
jgi:membrane-bound serine protease (ClpP class)